MPHKKILLYIPTLFLLTTACGPLVPLSYDKHDINSPTFQTIETDETTIILEYIGLKYDHYIFDLEVINHLPIALNVAPQLISFYASPKLFTTLSYSSDDVHTLSTVRSALTMKRQFANSPSDTRRLFKERAQAKASLSILFAAVGAGLAIYDAVKDSEDSQKETWTKKDENKAIGRNVLVNIAFTSSDVAKLSAFQAEEESHYIPYELFPECTIKPGKNMRGKIFIPKESSYRYSRVVIPIMDTDYVFDFKRCGVNSTQSQSPRHPSWGDPHR